jgi:hypothetical protein
MTHPPDRRFAKSQQGRLLWAPGDPHPLDDLFQEAQQAQEQVTAALTRLQETVRQFASRELAQAPEALPQALTTAEVSAERAAHTTLKDQKHYHHAQALLAYLRRRQMSARLQVAQAAIDLAAALLEPDEPGEDAADVLGQLGRASDWRKQVAQFEQQVTALREQFTRSEGWFDTRLVRRGKRVHGPYLTYRWRESDGRVYTVYLGRTDREHGEAPAEFTPGAWAGYQVFTKRQPARSPEELLIAGLRRLAEQSAFGSKSDRKFGKSLLEQSQVRPLTVPQLRALYSLLARYQAALESGEQGLALPDPERLEDYLTEREAAHVQEPRGKIDATATTYIVRFPFDEARVRQVKAIWKKHGGPGWQERLKVWSIGDTAGLDLFAAFPDFERTPEALALHEQMLMEVQARAEAEARAREQVEREQAAWAAFRRQQLRQLDLAQPLSPSGRVLFAHQREAVHWLLSNGKGILADDLGLGKTSSALVAAKALELPILVICPVTLKDNWLAEAQFVDACIQVHSWAKIPAPPETDFVLICDEAAYAQTWDAQRTQAMIRLARAPACRATYLLSGTPIKNGRPANLYPLLYALDHRLAQDKQWYERYYCAARATQWTTWDISGAAHLDELHREISDILLRRRKQDCLDLPAKTRVRRPAEVSAPMRARYEETLTRLRAEYQRRVEAGEIMDKGELLVMLNHLRQAGSLAKTETAVTLVEELVEQEQQAVVFTAFVDSARQMVDALRAEGISAELLIGETPVRARGPLVKRFQAGQVSALICTLGTGGVGLTLTAASTVILVDRAWTPGDTEQAEDRIHRIGQIGAVTAIWVAYGKIDHLIDDLLEEKAGRIGQVLGEPTSLTPLDHLDDLARLLFAESEDVVNEKEE